MLNLSNISIKNKLIIIQLSTAILTIVLCGIFFVISFYRIFNNYKIESLKSITEVVGDDIASAVYLGSNEKEYVIESLAKIKKIKPIVNSTVYRQHDTANTFAEHIVTPYQFTLPTFAESNTKLIHQLEGDFVNIYYQMYSDTQFAGTLCVRADLQLGVILRQYINISLIVLGIGFLIALLLAALFQKSISDPVLKLVSTMRFVSRNQDYAVRARERGRDEISELSKVFNEMLEQIQKRDKSLQDAQINLEARVEERTRQLAQKTKALKISNKELERFAYVASHDLQEPLRMIGSFSQLIARRYENQVDAEMDEFIHYIVDGVSRMQKLIKDLLLFSRVGTRKISFAQTDMSIVLHKSLSNLRYVIQESSAKITADSLPTIVIDEVKITQLFQNLLSNAIKFRSEEPPLIHISVEEHPDEWKFYIEDNGIGIEEEYAERIFMIFQRLNNSAYPGTGIGLAICKKIVAMHGGEIYFTSELNKGTTFYFTLKKINLAEEEDIDDEKQLTSSKESIINT